MLNVICVLLEEDGSKKNRYCGQMIEQPIRIVPLKNQSSRHSELQFFGTFDFLLDVEGRLDTEGLLEVEDFGRGGGERDPFSALEEVLLLLLSLLLRLLDLLLFLLLDLLLVPLLDLLLVGLRLLLRELFVLLLDLALCELLDPLLLLLLVLLLLLFRFWAFRSSILSLCEMDFSN